MKPTPVTPELLLRGWKVSVGGWWEHRDFSERMTLSEALAIEWTRDRESIADSQRRADQAEFNFRFIAAFTITIFTGCNVYVWLPILKVWFG